MKEDLYYLNLLLSKKIVMYFLYSNIKYKINLLNKHINEVAGVLDENHNLITKMRDLIKRRNLDYQETEKEIPNLLAKTKDEYTRKKNASDFVNRLRKVEYDFKQKEKELMEDMKAHFKRYEGQVRDKLAIFILQQHVQSHLGAILLSIPKEEKTNELKDPEIQVNKAYISKVFYFTVHKIQRWNQV